MIANTREYSALDSPLRRLSVQNINYIIYVRFALLLPHHGVTVT